MNRNNYTETEELSDISTYVHEVIVNVEKESVVGIRTKVS